MRNISKNNKVFSAARAGVNLFLALATCLILVFSFFVNFRAASAEEVKFKNPVRACIFNFEGYHNVDGKQAGYGIEFLNLVSEYSHINFEFVNYDGGWNWDAISDMLKNDEIDVVTSASRSKDREKDFAFSLPIGRKSTVLSIRVDDDIHHRGDYESYNGIKVGMINGNSANSVFEDWVGGEDGTPAKFTYEKFDDFIDDAELALALQKGEIDAILSSDLRKTNNEKTLDVIKEDDFYAVVRKEDTGLLEEINYAIEQMDINEGDWQNVLFYKYYGPSYSSSLTFTAREMAYIKQVVETEPIKVTAFGGRAPYSFVENGQLKGIIPDYFEEIMSLAGRTAGLDGKLPYEVVIPKDHEDYHNLINEKAVNVAVDNMTYEGGGFNTDSYMTATMAMVTRRNHGDIKVVAVSESQGMELIPQEILEGRTVKEYNTGEEAMQAVLDGKADAAYVFTYTAQLFVNRNTSDSLYYSVMNAASTSFSMYVSEDTDHELITILNKCIKQTSDDTLNRLASNYTSFTIDDLNVGEFIAAHPEILIAIAAVIVAIAVVIITLVLRGQWNKKLLKATAQSNREMGEQLAIVEALSREYVNVYSVNEERSTARIIKLEGYVADGLKKGSGEEYDYASVLEKYINSRVHVDDRLELAQALSLKNVKNKLEEENEYQGSYRIVENGETHHFQYTYLKITDNDKRNSGFILLGFRNIDELIRKEQEQKEVLAEALTQAQYANRAKTTFLNSMSHDIRTPMNAIIGFTNLAAGHIDDKDLVKNYLSKIMTSGNHLLSLINDVLDMSRIESGKVKIDEKETSLPEIMNDLKTIVQADVKAKQLELKVETVNVKNKSIICDKLRLNQVLLNILSNAVKYTKAGGKVNFRVTQTAEAPAGYASYQFSVKDTGIGMSKEFLQHVFEPFEREQTSTVSGIQGTGLGLAITKNIVDMMGGTITVESEMGKGSEFIVTFCFRVGESKSKSKQTKQKGAKEQTERTRFEGKKILLVEDNELNQEIAQTVLEAEGFVIDTADDGSIAVNKMKEAPAGTYDLILMDVQMPIMNGYQATKAIRALEDAKKAATPIVAMTANAFDEDRKEAMEAGMNGYVDKPISVDKLMKTLEEILK